MRRNFAAATVRVSVMTAVMAVAMMTSGCHHQPQTVAYVPPPPPAARSHASAKSSANTHPALAPESPATNSSSSSSNNSASGKVISSETGMSSWYGPPYHNRKGANGEIYNENAMTAAHRTLPMGSVVRVTNLATGQSATVKITDRGPFVHGRILDLSLAAAKATGVYRAGVAKVRVDVLSMPHADGNVGKWCVQVGAFSKPGNATRLKSDLIRRYQTAKVIEFPGPTGHWVRISPTQQDKTHAMQIASGIHPAEPDAEAYVVRLD